MTTYNPDELVVVKGFRVEITGPDGGTSEDSAWEMCTGGALIIEEVDTSVGTPGVGTPGHKSIDEITLRGPMAASRRWIGQNINQAINDPSHRFHLIIIEILKDRTEGRRFIYQDCFITRYVYPHLDANGTGNLYEEVSIKPEQLATS